MHSHEILSDLVADQIRMHRTRLGLNREQLAEECARIGAPELTYATITNIETGRRDKSGKRRREVTVDELMTFAYALGVPPLLLALPLGSVDRVPSPTRWGGLHPHYAWRWVTGEEPPASRDERGRIIADSTKIGGGDGPGRMEVWRQVSVPTEVYRSLQAAQAALQKATGRHHFAQERHGADAEETRKARGVYLDRLQDLATVLNEMTELGLRIPEYDARWVQDMREFGLLDHPEAVPVSKTQAGEGAE
ncbi:helix-turn-helix transcriptional regulator [Streptomyces sp. BPTC-684]|uniref:helix-turn-helix domain-containing protein n=1 Tax=Streptomyces sp. BPTC-684 TaxID=3043734 RepID=UPI0024B17A7E|nr:helix-turn-helix transcriptional regulator [Streptomyces sp. BPTC-684]WHM37561.1 helix-turn-helix transcriptional regulator [Streptomyces sp. BPTC-684]